MPHVCKEQQGEGGGGGGGRGKGENIGRCLVYKATIESVKNFVEYLVKRKSVCIILIALYDTEIHMYTEIVYSICSVFSILIYSTLWAGHVRVGTRPTAHAYS